MSNAEQHRMTVDEFLRWTEGREGRWELYNGVPYLMAPERVRHGKVKFAVQSALANGIISARLDCHMLPDGMTVRTSDVTAHEPDALVYCGEELPGDDVEVSAPVIVVEVASPSTRRIDATLKLSGYFSLPSIHHYLIVDPEGPPIIHHQRRDGGTVLTNLIREGDIAFSPPGLTISLSDIFA